MRLLPTSFVALLFVSRWFEEPRVQAELLSEASTQKDLESTSLDNVLLRSTAKRRDALDVLRSLFLLDVLCLLDAAACAVLLVRVGQRLALRCWTGEQPFAVYDLAHVVLDAIVVEKLAHQHS